MYDFIFKGKRIDNNKWHFGDLRKNNNNECFIKPQKFEWEEVIPETISLNSTKKDRYGKDIYSGHVLKTIHSDLILTVCFGEYQAFCPYDKSFMDNIGFYIKADGCKDMPLGPTEEYAEIIGDIWD